MANNTSTAGTKHVVLLASKALDTKKGISVECKTEAEAIKLRQIFHSLRYKDRNDSKKIWPEGHPKHGTSIYDSLETVLEKEEGKWVITFQDVVSKLSGLTIIDRDTGEHISIEEI